MTVRQLLELLGYTTPDPDTNVRSALTELVQLRKTYDALSQELEQLHQDRAEESI